MIKTDSTIAKTQDANISEKTQLTIKKLKDAAKRILPGDLQKIISTTDDPVIKKIAQEELKRRNPTLEDLQEASKNTPAKDLHRLIKESPNELHRRVANNELARRGIEESAKKFNKKYEV